MACSNSEPGLVATCWPWLLAFALLGCPTAMAASLAESGLQAEAAASDVSQHIDGRDVRMVAVPSSRATGYLGLLRAEFERYPAALVRGVGLKRVVVCGPLTVEGQTFLGTYDCDGGAIYYTAQDLRRNLHYARVVLHHEFYHFLTQKQTGDIYTDARWSAVNRPGFGYGEGGSAMQADFGCAELVTGTPGFLTRYATAGLEEDKAETFAHLMVDRDFVLRRAASDPVLAAKVTLLAQELAPYGGAGLWSGSN
ncbi:MAG: hypothetical protein JWM80_6147 [Cyanobacteria bacterium RYN_339]|nr:hypothetical protein [Cyanobacteria bacterium RYN_339]